MAALAGLVMAVPFALPASAASDSAPCRKGGYADYVDPNTDRPFKNQGRCQSFIRGGGSLVTVGEAPPPDGGEVDVSNADIVFVGASLSWGSQSDWSYMVGLRGFPADTVVEMSGPDQYGNHRVGMLGMTEADGSWNPFTRVNQSSYTYGTCDEAESVEVIARGKGFRVTEPIPRPAECDGGTTPDGGFEQPTYPPPPPPPSAPPMTSPTAPAR